MRRFSKVVLIVTLLTPSVFACWRCLVSRRTILVRRASRSASGNLPPLGFQKPALYLVAWIRRHDRIFGNHNLLGTCQETTCDTSLTLRLALDPTCRSESPLPGPESSSSIGRMLLGSSNPADSHSDRRDGTRADIS